MKTILSILILATATINGQYDHWSGEIKTGAVKIRDVTSVQPINFDIGVRYMANINFGGKASLNYTKMPDYRWQSASLMGVANAGRIMGFEDFTKWYTILVGVGGNYEYADNDTNEAIFHRLSNFHLQWEITNEFKLSRSIFLTLGLNVTEGVNSRPEPSTNYTETTSIINFNVGITVSLGREKEHADWYIPEPIVTSRDTTIIENHYHDVTRMVDKPFTGYVQFGYDSFRLKDGSQGMATVKSALEAFKIGDTFLLTGYASEENGTGNPNYNDELSEKRAQTVKSYLISLGVDPLDIDIEPMGALYTWDGENIELSRTVKIEIR